MKEPTILYIAVKALIKDGNGRVLVLKQSDPTITGDGTYHPPGGIVELGESLQECLKREIYEELGVESKVVDLFDIGEWYAERGSDYMQFVGAFYVCELFSDYFTLQQSEANEFRWIGIDDIDSVEVLEPSHSIIKKFLRK